MLHDVYRRSAMAVIAVTIALLCASAAANTPINDLGTGLYLGQYQGGLYMSGSNVMPTDHSTEGLRRAGLIEPRDVNGDPDPNGHYILTTLGMSNTNIEGRDFIRDKAVPSAQVNHDELTLYNGAYPSQTAPYWVDTTTPMAEGTVNNYTRVAQELDNPPGNMPHLEGLDLSPLQIEVAWVKGANASPLNSLSSGVPDSQKEAYRFLGQLAQTVRTMKGQWPNLQMVFFSTRIWTPLSIGLNPEPFAYEYAYPVQWLIQAQILQMRGQTSPWDAYVGDLRYTIDGQDGPAPWLAWGPYLWADGGNPRSDGLTWTTADLQADQTHPSAQGSSKVGDMMMDFFSNSPFTESWFLSGITNTAPVAGNNGYSVNQDTTLSISAPGVLGNDTDADQDPLSVTQVTNSVDHGSLDLNADGSFTYTPTAAYYGADAFTYEISDGQGGTDTADVSITVVQVIGGGDATLLADYGSHERNGQNSTNGSETAYTFNQNYTIYVHFDLGSVSFEIDTAKLRLYQTPSNATAAMVVGAYKVTQSWDEASLSGLAFPSYDATLLGSNTILQAGAPAYFEIELDAATVEAMRTGANYGFRVAKSGGSTITALTFDSDEGTNRPQLVLTGAGGGNQAPVAASDSYGTNEDVTLVVNSTLGVLANDTDLDGGSLAVTQVTDNVDHGSLSLAANGSFTYTPTANWNGSDAFTYEVSDGQGGLDTAVVGITVTAVNDAPTANNDSGYTATQNSYVTISAPGVLANDTDIDSPSISAYNPSDPAHGSVSLNANGSFTYTPDAGYAGPDSFTYQAYDGDVAYSTPATVSITVSGGGSPQTLYTTSDSYVTSGAATTNYGTAGTLQVRYTGGSVQRQSYVYFDLSGIAFTVSGATLRVYQTGTASTSVTVDVYAAASSWVEGVITWNAQPGTTGNSLGNVATRTTTDGVGWIEITLTPSAIESMRTGNNYGLVLVPRTGGTTNAITFYSREGGNDAELVVSP